MKKLLTTFRLAVLVCILQNISSQNAFSNRPYLQELNNISVNGKVMDGNGVPLVGVNISVSNSKVGTITDANGEYSLTSSSNGILTFSIIGFETKEVDIDNKKVINVQLIESVSSLDELKVIGYGTRKKSQMTGSIASVSSKDIKEVPVTDAGQALQGRAAGVSVLSSGTKPGDGVTIRVRGRRSLNASKDPLYVVDGIPLEGGINDINPGDIKSMEVLKDASATAIYGSRGANGVVLITTNRGGNHKAVISYNGYAGVSQVLGMPNMMNGQQFERMKRISGFAFSTVELDAIEKGISTDWTKLVIQKGFQQSHQLSVNGGNENTQFLVSVNLFKENGVVKTQDFLRNTLRINLDHAVSEKLKIGTSTQLSRQVKNVGDNVVDIALPSRPLSPAYDSLGNIFHNPGGDVFLVSPLESLEKNAALNEQIRTRVFSNLYAKYQFSKHFNYQMNFGIDLQNSRTGVYESKLIRASTGRGTDFAAISNNQTSTYTFENIVGYQADFADVHSLDITGLYSIQKMRDESSSMGARNLPYAHQLFYNIGSASTIQSISSNLLEWGLSSFMGRLNYAYKDKYLLTLTGRADGSSRFAPKNKWGFFPSAALAWRAIDESFLRDQNVLSDLSFKISYGVVGNTAISPYQTRGGLGRTAYSFGGAAFFGFSPNSIPNPDLKWEKSKSLNISLDFGFYKNAISGTIEVYQTNTSDLLLQRVIPITSGYNSVLQNIGETRNRGFELSLNTKNIQTKRFSWTTDFNLFANKEQIVKLFDSESDDIGNKWFIGNPLSIWYDYQKEGIWQLSEKEQANKYGQQPGDIKVKDVDENGIINQDDRVILGSDIPRINFGFSNRFTYNSFDLSFLLFGSFGHTLYNNFEVNNSTMVGRYNNLNVDYWTPDNPTNDHPRPNGAVERPLYSESRGYTSGNFLKVRNIQLGFNLPSNLITKYGIKSMRVYANAETPFVFSKLGNNLDPEQAGGFISGNTPSARLYTFGVNVNF